MAVIPCGYVCVTREKSMRVSRICNCRIRITRILSITICSFPRAGAVPVSYTHLQTQEKKTNGKPVVSKEEKVTMTHGDVMKKYNVIVGSFSNEDNAIRLRNRLIGEGYNLSLIHIYTKIFLFLRYVR